MHLYSPMHDVRLPIIAKIADALNKAEVRWAIGGSTLLFLKGIDFEFNDLDIVVLEEDAQKAKEALLSIGAAYHKSEKAPTTKVFEEFTVDGLDVDVISGFIIQAYGKEFDCSFKNENVEEIEVEGVKVRLDSLEAWQNIYQLQDRQEKAHYITDYLRYHK